MEAKLAGIATGNVKAPPNPVKKPEFPALVFLFYHFIRFIRASTASPTVLCLDK